MSTTRFKLVYSLLNVSPGDLTVMQIRLPRWGSIVHIDCIYRYPPEEKPFRLVFTGCRGIEWNVIRTEIGDNEVAQVLTHDLGEAHYQRPARFVTVLAEVVIIYDELMLEKQW